MSSSSSASPSSSRNPIAANAGISLSAGNGAYLVLPRGMQRPDSCTLIEPFILPMVPAPLVEFAAGWLRHVWRAHRRCCCWLLYLGLQEPHNWVLQFPPQVAGNDSFLCDLSFAGFAAPADAYRLAGSFRSEAYKEKGDLRDELSGIDGLHLVMHPEFDWLQLLAFVHLDEQMASVPVSTVMADDLQRYAATDLSQRLRLLDEA